MADGVVRRAWSRRLYVGATALLFLHFFFLWPLTLHVPPLSVALLLAAAVFALPWLRRRLARVPLLRVGWLRAAVQIALVAFANVLLVGAGAPALEQKAYAFVGATLISGHRDSVPITNGVVLVGRDGKIVRVGAAAAVPISDAYTVVDLRGQYLLPGLINAHGHLMLPGETTPGEPVELSSFALPDWVQTAVGGLLETYPGQRIALALMERNARAALEAGVTTLRGLGDPHFLDVELRGRVESGQSRGPRLLVSGPILCVTGGHAHQIGQVIDGPDEARRAVRNALLHRVDVIKIAGTGGVADSRRIGEAGELQMTPQEMAAVVDEAHRKHFLVAAHAESSAGVKEALLAGVDSIEHGAPLDREMLALFKDNPNALRGYTTLHPTLSVIAGEMVISDEIREHPILSVMIANGRDIKQRMLTGFKQAVDAGVRIGVGTDAGIVRHDSVWKELEYFVAFGGVSNALALHWGTLGTAESIGVDQLTGSLDPGKFADFLIVDENPLQDLSALESPALVVMSGRLVQPR